MNIYPIKFSPILKEKIWGGNKLSRLLNKDTTKNNIGESWEVSDVKGNVSVVANGPYKGLTLSALMRKFQDSLLGVENLKTYGLNFPLLIKFLDAKTDLSVQVHPDDGMANTYHDSFGKTEMWYIMDSDIDANIVLGLKDKSQDLEILQNITSDNVETIFNREFVKKGDGFFIPAGKIHAIGAGVLAAEIQQTSDVTYRVYDWDRKDDQGQKRELHTKLAKKATKHFNDNAKSDYSLKANSKANIVDCQYFTTNILDITSTQERDYSTLDAFVIFMCVEGEVTIKTGHNSETIRMGETVLLPAVTKHIIFKSQQAKLLEVYIKNKPQLLQTKMAS